MFITFEGIDGCGKSTQLKLLGEHLESIGYEIRILREPGGLPLSEELRSILLNSEENIHPITELLLFEASRSHLVHNLINPELLAGKAVLCDRFYDSTTAYQGYGRGLELDLIHRLNQVASLGRTPDLTIYLDLDYSQTLSRCNNRINDRIERSGREFYDKIANGFRELAKQFPERIMLIDADGEIGEVHNRILAIVKQKFNI